jgi:hypothetical protein
MTRNGEMKVYVSKKGKLLMGNARKGTPRSFKDLETARNFVKNLIWVSKNLTPSDFVYMN